MGWLDDPINDIIDWVDDALRSVQRDIDYIYDWVYWMIDRATDTLEWAIESARSLASDAWDIAVMAYERVDDVVASSLASALRPYDWVIEQATDFFSTGIYNLKHTITQVADDVNDLWAYVTDEIDKGIRRLEKDLDNKIKGVTSLVTDVKATFENPERLWSLLEQTIEAVW